MYIGQIEIGAGICPMKEQIIQVYPEKFNKLKKFLRNKCLKFLFLNQESFTCPYECLMSELSHIS